MKKRHLVTLKVRYLDGSHRSGAPVPTWIIDSDDGYIDAGWVFHRPPKHEMLVHGMHSNIELRRLDEERFREFGYF